MTDGWTENGIKIHTVPLSVTVVDGEIILDSMHGSAPSLSADAARETEKRLIRAADQLEAVR